MSKWKESQCDKLVQEIATMGKSQWSNYQAECGHHNIRRGNLLWRWRLINICPLTFEEHGMLHAGLLNPLYDWQQVFFQENRNTTLERYLHENGMIREEFVNQAYEYLKKVKDDIAHGITTFEKVVKKEREEYGTL